MKKRNVIARGIAAQTLAIALCTVAVDVAIAPSRADAQEFSIARSLEDKVFEAETIAVVDVVAATSHRNARGNLIVTDFRFRTVQSVLGNAQPEFKLTQGGGSFNGETHQISDTAKLVVGQRYLVFVRPHPGTMFSPFVGGAQGVFAYVGDAAISLDGHAGTLDRDQLLAEVQTLVAQRGTAGPRPGPHGSMPAGSYPSKAFKPLALTPPSNVATRAPVVAEAAAAPTRESLTGDTPVQALDAESSRTIEAPDAHWSHLIAPPAVIDAFPHDWEWHPYEENQLAYWNEYGGDVFRVYTEPTGDWAWENDRFDLAGWPDEATMIAQFGEGWAADTTGITYSRWFDSDGIIVESDTALNPSYCWTLDDVYAVNGTNACQGFRQTMLHETGHSWGLDHPWESQVVAWDSVMNYSPTSYRFARIDTDDAVAVRSAFAGPAFHDALLSLYTVSASSGVGQQAVYTPTQYQTQYLHHGDDLASSMTGQFKIENLGTDDVVSPQIDFYLSQNRMSWDGSVYLLGSGIGGTVPPNTILNYWLPSLPISSAMPTGWYYFAAYLPNADSEMSNNGAWATQNWNNETVQIHVDNNPTSLVPTNDWQASEVGSLGPSGTWSFYFYADAGATYYLSLCPGTGGWANFDTVLSISSGGSVLASSDDACDLQSDIVWTAPYSGTFTATVGSYNNEYQGSFQLGYRRDVTGPADPVYHDGFDG